MRCVMIMRPVGSTPRKKKAAQNMVILPRAQDEIVLECDHMHWVLYLLNISNPDLTSKFATELLVHARWRDPLYFASIADMLLNDCVNDKVQ